MPTENEALFSADGLRALLTAALSARGCSADFIKTLLEQTEELTTSAARLPARALFAAPLSPARFRALLPAEFRGVSPEQAAQKLHFLTLLCRVEKTELRKRGLFFSDRPPGKTPPAAIPAKQNEAAPGAVKQPADLPRSEKRYEAAPESVKKTEAVPTASVNIQPTEMSLSPAPASPFLILKKSELRCLETEAAMRRAGKTLLCREFLTLRIIPEQTLLFDRSTGDAAPAFLRQMLRPAPGETETLFSEDYAAMKSKLPTAEETEAILAALQTDPFFIKRETERKRLFSENLSEEPPLLIERIRFVRTAYSVGTPAIGPLADRMCRQAPDPAPGQDMPSAVAFLQQIAAGNDSARYYAFAVTYCACKEGAASPVFNGDVALALEHLRENRHFYPFLNDDLRNYKKYLQVLRIFREACGCAALSPAQTAFCLEAYGRALRKAENKQP